MAKKDDETQAGDLLQGGAGAVQGGDGDGAGAVQGGDGDGAGAELVSVVLNCVLSGYPGDPGPGATIKVDAAEAERLVETLGVADYD